MKVVITGISSYTASLLIPLLESDGDIGEILGIDVIEPKSTSPKIRFVKKDIRDEGLVDCLEGYDAILHLAFIVVPPLPGRQELYSINIDGSKNVFDCSMRAGLKKIVYSSSSIVYGAFPDNPVPMTEDQPIRLMPKHFYYNETKYYVEKHLDDFEKKHPEVMIARLRPCPILGAQPHWLSTGNRVYCSRPNVLMQFVWCEDVAEAFFLAIKNDVHGVFNIGADNPLSPKEIAKKTGRKCVNLGYYSTLSLAHISYKLRFQRSLTPGWIRASRYPIVADASKAKRVLGWTPKYDCLETIMNVRNCAK
jgi:nucleoside-diphosphate-sugar epimerase